MSQAIAKVAINRHIVDKNISGNAYYMANEWENVELPIEELMKLVAVNGNAFCAQLYGIRNSLNFKCTNLVSLDVDAGITLREALEDEFSKKYLTFFYTTSNHTVEENRFRLGFLLEREIDDALEYTAIKRALGLRYCGDPSTFDPSRISFGNQNAAYEIFDAKMPSEIIEELIEQGKPPSLINKTDSITGDFNNTIRRSDKKLSRDKVVKTKSGFLTKLIDVQERTPIHCFNHRDSTSSAFASKNSVGSTYVFCTVCQTTWWVESINEQAIKYREENDFVKVIKSLPTKVSERADERIFPEDISPKKYPLAQIPAVDVFNREYLKVKALHQGLTLIRSPKGSGKTESLTEIIRNLVASKKFQTLEDIENTDPDEPPRSYTSDYKVLLIGHRQALIRQLCERLSLNCYLDDKDYSFQEIRLRKKRYGVCLDSLWKVTEINYDLVVIDESEQVLAHMLSDTMKQRETIYKVLTHVIGTSKNVVALDADLGWTSYLTLTEMRNISTPTHDRKNRVWVQINEHLADNNPIDIYSSKEELVGQMMMDIEDGKKIFVASNSKRLIERLHASIEKTFGEDKSFAVTSANSRTDEVQFSIMNFKATFEKYNVLLCSPSLGTGIDITFEDGEQIVDCCYGFFESLINTHLDIDQQLRRVRHPKQVRVWISPRKFNFETEFGVVQHQLLADKVIANTFIGFEPVTHEELYNEDDKFLVLATHVISNQRLSQNNLKQNFIEYKKSTGWASNLISNNDAYADQGREFLSIGRQLEDEAFVQQILNASPIDRFQFQLIQEALEGSLRLPESSYWSFRRMTLELFYQQTLTEEIIRNDNRGERRTQFKLYKAISNQQQVREINKQLGTKFGARGRGNRFDRLKDRDVKIGLMYYLLSSSPVFKEGNFDLTAIYTSEDLTDFIQACQKLRPYIEGQFLQPIREDIEKKPTAQLHWFLKMVGITTLNQSKKVKNRKVYQYMIDPESYNSMMSLVELRNAVKDDWSVVNVLNGFKNEPNFEN